MRTQFELNGQRLFTSDPKEILNVCLTSFNINYWSFDALQQYLKGTIENLQIFCQAKIKESQDEKTPLWAVIDPRRFRYFITWSNKLLRNMPDSEDAEHMCRYIFNVVLACEGLGLLPGFGMANKHGGKVKGNPEVKSIYGIEPFEQYVRRKTSASS